MKITGEWIADPRSQAVCAMLADAGYQALFVGGCVRNALIGAEVADIDIATDARPEQVMDLATAAGFHAVPTGIDHGTVTVVSDHLPHEITTFRRDIRTDGRHADVEFSDNVTEDAQRRDFTMNALYARPDGQVIDPLGGLPDLNIRRVRFVGDAHARIREDHLRSLRLFRFHAWYGDADAGLDPEALAAVAAHLDGLERLSRERIGAEMVKLLAAPDPAPSVAAMRQAGVLARVLEGADDTALAPLVHLEGETSIAPDPMRRLAALGGEAVARSLRLSKVQARQLEVLRDAMVGSAPAHELGYRLGADAARDALLLRAAQMEQPVDPAALDLAADAASRTFPIRAADLMPGLEGPALGKRLEQLEAHWIASRFTLDRRALLRLDLSE